MTLKFKSARKYYIYDSVSGIILPITHLESEMFDTLTVPLPPVCPTMLRYDFARYDSDDIACAYGHLYDLYKDKQIFVLPENGKENLIKFKSEISESVAQDALDAFFSQCSKTNRYNFLSNKFSDIALRIAQSNGIEVIIQTIQH